MKNICVISPGFPTKTHPFFPFVKMVVDEFCKQGYDVIVIAPQSWLKCRIRGVERHPLTCQYQIGNNKVYVYQPFYLSFGNHFEAINQWVLESVINKAFKKLPVKPDVIYAHFWHSGYYGFNYAKKNQLKLFVVSGESTISFRADNKNKIDYCKYVNGVICVSTKNKDESIKLGLSNAEKMIVLPNAINNKLFYKKNKATLREQYGFANDLFIVCFVGWFNHRKGADRVANALTRINNHDIKAFFIGAGLDQELVEPIYDNIIFKGYLPHDKISDYLNMADLFVMPTLHEGCCNAIIEAMACGLPVVSSNLPFNWDVLDDTNSIMIDPENIEDISRAINALFDDRNRLGAMSTSALEKAKSLTIEERCKKIIGYMNK